MKKILWFRHDLRIEDNEAFNKACNDGDVLPIFIYDEGYWNLETSSSFHLNFTKESLEELNNCLLYTSPSPRDRTRSRMPSSA